MRRISCGLLPTRSIASVVVHLRVWTSHAHTQIDMMHLKNWVMIHGIYGRNNCVLVCFTGCSWAGTDLFMYSCNSTAQKDRATGEEGPVTELKLGTYVLSRSFNHTSHRSQSRSSVPNRPLVPIVCLCVFSLLIIRIYMPTSLK